MQTVMNSRMLDAVMELRAQGQWKIPCVVIAGGKLTEALMGPRVRNCPNSVRVQVDGVVQTVSLGAISVTPDVAARLQAVIDAQDAVAEAEKAEKELKRRAMSDQNLLNQILLQRHQARRNPSGQFAAHHCEPAGRR